MAEVVGEPHKSIMIKIIIITVIIIIIIIIKALLQVRGSASSLIG